MEQDTLSTLFSDPEALQTAMKTVSGLFGSTASGTAAEPSAHAKGEDYDPSAELIERALPVLSTVLQSAQQAVGPEKRTLLNAVKPFVTEQVSAQFDHAMRLVSMAQMARAALGQLGQQEAANDAAAQPL